MNQKNVIKSAGGVVVRKTKTGFSIILLYKNNHWVLPKGRTEKGESEKETAIREIHEEINIPLNRMKIITKLGKINYITHQPVDNYLLHPKIVSYFLVETSYKKIRPLKTDGFRKASWFNLESALRKVTFPESKAMILKAIEKITTK